MYHDNNIRQKCYHNFNQKVYICLHAVEIARDTDTLIFIPFSFQLLRMVSHFSSLFNLKHHLFKYILTKYDVLSFVMGY